MDGNEKWNRFLSQQELFERKLRPVGQIARKEMKFFQEEKPRISTGIFELDLQLGGGLAEELYILGAETSTGKSAFMQWLAENVSKANVCVLYFALEMGLREMMARGASSLMYQEQGTDAVPFRNMLHWVGDERTRTFSKTEFSAYQDYMEQWVKAVGDNLRIVTPGLDGIDAETIAEIATGLKEYTKRQVVVFVDYLQVLKSTGQDRKSKVDHAAMVLKNLSLTQHIPVFAASSVNRGSYGRTVGTEGFKESGDLEYTGGILLGWNWLGVTDAKDKAKRQAAIQESKETGHRRICVEILKNRNSERGSGVELDYYPAYNAFCIPADGENDQPQEKDFREEPIFEDPESCVREEPEAEDSLWPDSPYCIGLFEQADEPADAPVEVDENGIRPGALEF